MGERNISSYTLNINMTRENNYTYDIFLLD